MLTLRTGVSIEHGIIRGTAKDDVAISMVADAKGIYYDARQASDLEELVAAPFDQEKRDRAAQIVKSWRNAGISHLNAERDPIDLPQAPYVVVVDQFSDDPRISEGLADASAFKRMMSDAVRENPDCTIVVLRNPDIAKGKKNGVIDTSSYEKDPRIVILDENTHPVQLIKAASKLYTVTSHLGFDALMHGVETCAYGIPFYGGYGFTIQRNNRMDVRAKAAEDRRVDADFLSFVHAALVDYPSYIDTIIGEKTTVERAIGNLGRYRERMKMRRGTIHAIAFNYWKKPVLREVMAPAQIEFHRNLKDVPLGATVALWGAAGTEHLDDTSEIIRIEDGFIRSKGLGATHVRPSSWVFDPVGIYFDSTRPSRLENILQTQKFTEDLLRDGREIRTAIVEGNMTKYNLSGKPWRRPRTREQVILVPGQVETDASIKFGSPVVRSNYDLVAAVRAMHPTAYIIYKPHPDVAGGYREVGNKEDQISKICDEVIAKADILSLIEQVDQVHTMTSLSGFEALIRNVPVTCHGQPFYSGWGLTTDIHPCPRRTRKLTLDELVTAAVILYPEYFSMKDGSPITAIAAIEEIKAYRPRILPNFPGFKKFYKKVARMGEKKRQKASV